MTRSRAQRGTDRFTSYKNIAEACLPLQNTILIPSTKARMMNSASPSGVEAAHVQWHAFGGLDRCENGVAPNPLMHMLLDRGAWSLTDDRRGIASAQYTGTEDAILRLRSLHGERLPVPLPGCSPVSINAIRWHREPSLGGVFREVALLI